MPLVCHNGFFLDAETPLFVASNAAFKWGDGVFETMRLVAGGISMFAEHFERLERSLRQLEMSSRALDKVSLEKLLIELSERNECSKAARVRLQLYREGTGVGFVAEAIPLPPDDLVPEESNTRRCLFLS